VKERSERVRNKVGKREGKRGKIKKKMKKMPRANSSRFIFTSKNALNSINLISTVIGP
jgi:hypothetical protein